MYKQSNIVEKELQQTKVMGIVCPFTVYSSIDNLPTYFLIEQDRKRNIYGAQTSHVS